MIFHSTPLPGLFEITASPHIDARGSFARAFCPQVFADHGIAFHPTQINLSQNTARHTLRGLHFQPNPWAEAKLVRCVAGKMWDVVVDLRPGATFLHWHAVILDAHAMNALFVPEGMAHGFITLHDDTCVLYQMGRDHVAGVGQGLRWDDPALAIDWPTTPERMSDQDATWPLLDAKLGTETGTGQSFL